MAEAIVSAIGVVLSFIFGLFGSGTSKANESWKDIPTVETICKDSEYSEVCELFYNSVISMGKEKKFISEDGKRWNFRLVLDRRDIKKARDFFSKSVELVPIYNGLTQEEIEKAKEVYLDQLEKEVERIYKEMGIRVR